MMKRLLLPILLALGACGNAPSNCQPLPYGQSYCMVEGIWPVFESEQATTIVYGDKSLRMISRITSGQQGVVFAGVSPLGQTLLSTSLVDGVLRSDQPAWANGRFNGALLLALLQLAVWPASEVAQGLSPGLALEEQAGRRVIRGEAGEELLTVSWQGNALPYERLDLRVPAYGLHIAATELKETP